MLFVIGVIFMSGCSSTVNVDTPSLQRDSLTTTEALIGHWSNSEGTADVYYSDSALTKVEKNGTKTEMTYVVLKSNDQANTISIRVTNPKGGDQDQEIKFSTDKKSMTDTVTVLGVKYSEDSYSYVDNKTKP